MTDPLRRRFDEARRATTSAGDPTGSLAGVRAAGRARLLRMRMLGGAVGAVALAAGVAVALPDPGPAATKVIVADDGTSRPSELTPVEEEMPAQRWQEQAEALDEARAEAYAEQLAAIDAEKAAHEAELAEEERLAAEQAEKEAATSTTTKPEPEPKSEPEPEPAFEELAIECARIGEPGEETWPVVCEWSPAAHPDFAVYELWRNREVVVWDSADRRQEDREWLRAEDPTAAAGIEHYYEIKIYDAAGNKIGASNKAFVAKVQPAPDPEPQYEELEIWCGRNPEEGVVCEWAISEHPDFARYVWKRDGEAIWTFDQREMPERPWPDIRATDPSADPTKGYVYKVFVEDAEGNVIGYAGPIEVPPTE